MSKVFKHSGDLGDIVYSLPTVKRLGGGTLLLDTTGGEGDPWCGAQCIDGRTKFNKDSYNFIKPLIEAQEYIVSCDEWKPSDHVDINLNGFRQKFSDPKTRSKTRNLIDLHLDYMGLDEWDYNDGWLTGATKATHDRKLIVCRSPRYQSNFSWFQSNRTALKDQAVFMGLSKEHELFEWTFNLTIPYLQVENALEMANHIAGCSLFIGNASFPLSLAVGLGDVQIIHEFDKNVPTTFFEGKRGMQYV